MHNLNRSSHDVNHGIENTKKGLSPTKKKFVDDQGLKKDHLSYDIKAINGRLNTLTPKWKKYEKSEREIAFNLYGSKRPIIRNHWTELEKNNGNKSIVCPICGLTDADEMDHFIPRGQEELFPEYATHYTNLIPLCHDCNHAKGDDWKESGKQIFFNAYFDKLDGIDILKCQILRDSFTGIASSKIVLNITGSENDICWRVVETVKRLKLLPRYTKDSNKILRRKTIEIKTEYSLQNKRYTDKNDYIKVKRDLITTLVSQADDFISKLTYNAIAASDDYWLFIDSQLP